MKRPILRSLLLAYLSVSICLARSSIATAASAKELKSLGLLDVTGEPFGADPSGRSDSTQALSRAMAHARSHRLAAFLPPGVYRISDTLQAAEAGPRGEADEVWDQRRYWPLMMLGSRAGKQRPKIFLAPESPGFEEPNKRKLVVYFHAGGPHEPPNRPRGAPGFINNKFVGIDIEIGEGNPGAVAIRMRGAQGTVIEDSTIDATHGAVGIEGACGSGGGFANVKIIGGRFGLDASASQPAPTITGLIFDGQTETAIVYRGRQTLTATGVRIITKSAGPAVLAEDLWTSEESSVDAGPGRAVQVAAWNGPICFVDSEVIFQAEPGVAFRSNAAVYLNNVFVKNARTLIDHREGGTIAGQPNRWTLIKEFARGYTMRPFRGYQYESPVYVDGTVQNQVADIVAGGTPPEDLQSRHIWDADFPSWESAGAVNVTMAPYRAKGDGKADDTDAIQRAINENEIVFLPKGRYRVSKTIDLRDNTKLVGVAPHLSALVVNEEDEHFSDRNNPQPILKSPDDADAAPIVAYLGTWPRGEGSYNLLWQSGGDSIIRDWIILFEGGMHLPIRHHAAAIVTGNGGGRWYHYYDETYNREYAPSYRHLLIDGTRQPLHIYQCNPEHARCQTNMEIRNAENVTLYGVKGEGNYPIVTIRHSSGVRVFGYGGNASPWPGTSVFVIEDCEDTLIASVFDSVRLEHEGDLEFFAGPGGDPTRWHAIHERRPDGSEILTAPLERPVLYKRGRSAISSQ